jgi:hypothetical protein
MPLHHTGRQRLARPLQTALHRSFDRTTNPEGIERSQLAVNLGSASSHNFQTPPGGMPAAPLSPLARASRWYLLPSGPFLLVQKRSPGDGGVHRGFGFRCGGTCDGEGNPSL